jgi:N-acetylglucosaminyldiphosphoundecaprenol N-acetyl-beta-D-mannosaminyltransferase
MNKADQRYGPARPRATAGIPTGELLGIKFALTDYEGVLQRIGEMVARGDRGYLCLTSVHGLMESRREPELAAVLNGATLNLPDGMPVVWALNLLIGGRPLRDRVYGPTLMEMACERAAATGTRVFLYGGHDEAALRELKTALRRRAPAIEIAGDWSPPHRDLSPGEEGEVAARIDESGAEIVWCGISTPRQEKWLARVRPRIQAPVMVSVGAAFDFLAGRVSQAPAGMQRRGLEWAYRMAREPRRLAPRYLRNNPAFIAAVARQYARQRRQRSARPNRKQTSTGNP